MSTISRQLSVLSFKKQSRYVSQLDSIYMNVNPMQVCVSRQSLSRETDRMKRPFNWNRIRTLGVKEKDPKTKTRKKPNQNRPEKVGLLGPYLKLG